METTTSHSPPLLMEIALGTTFTLGLVLNITTARTYMCRRPTVRGLAMAWCACDLLLLLGTPFLIVTMHTGSWPSGAFLCRIYMASSTLHQWAGSWLLTVTASFLLPFTIGKFESCTLLTALSLFVFTPTIFIFLYTKLGESNNASHCYIAITSMNDHLWISLIGFICSYHTPIIISICTLYITYKQRQYKEYPGPWKRVLLLQIGLLVAYTLLWLPHWVTQLRLLVLNETSEPDPLVAHLIAVLLTQINAAIAVPLLLLGLGRQSVGLSRQTSMQQHRCNSEGDVILSPTLINDGDSQEGLLFDNISRRSSLNTNNVVVVGTSAKNMLLNVSA